MIPAPSKMAEEGFESLREKGDAFLVITPPSLGPDSCGGHGHPGALDSAEPVKLRCHSTLLKLASPLLDDLMEACSPAKSGTAIELKVDGSPHAWLDILTLLYSTFLPMPTASSSKRKAPAAPSVGPAFSWESAAGMLPILHKYDMSSLLDRVVAWVGTQSMSGDSQSPAYALDWLDRSHALQLDALTDICNEQLNQVPLSLNPQHPSYVCTWLRLADERSLPALQSRCLALLNTGAADGGGSGLQLSLDPGSESYVLGLLSMVHSSGHCAELQPLRKKCMHSIRRAAEKGTLQEDGGGGGGPEQPSGGRVGRARSIVHELLHPPAPVLDAHSSAAAASADAPRPGAESAASAPGSGASGSAARLDGLSALAEGLLHRSVAHDQMCSRMQGARDVYLCSNCGHGIAVFKPQNLRKMASWLRFVSSNSAPATLPCPVCGNASCNTQPNPSDCKVMWAL